MNPQGSLPFNPETFRLLAEQIENAAGCAELQALIEEAMGSAQAVLDGIGAQMAALGPIVALLQAPTTDPSKIVTWIKDFITAYLRPYVQPMLVLPLQLAALVDAIAQLEAAIASASGRLSSCTLSVPSLNIPTLPPVPEFPPLEPPLPGGP